MEAWWVRADGREALVVRVNAEVEVEVVVVEVEQGGEREDSL